MGEPKEHHRDRAGFIGLGSQGGPMARRIIDSGFVTTLWARRQASLDAFVDTNAAMASSPRELGAQSDVVGICVYADGDVMAVVEGPDGLLAGMDAGSVLCIHSTVHPHTVAAVETLAAHRGVRVLDAPVSGGGAAAAEQRLTVMVGGDVDAFERAAPILNSFGNPVRLLGPLGSGTRVKLLNNMLLTAILGVSEDALVLAEDLGADRQAVAEVIATSSGGSLAMRSLAHFGGLAEFAAGEGGPLLAKDARLLAEVIRSAGVGDRSSSLLAAARRALMTLEG